MDYEKRQMSQQILVHTEYADQRGRVPERKSQYNDGDAKKVVLKAREKFRCETYLPTI